MDISMLKEYHNCSVQPVAKGNCKQEFFKQFLESNFELIQSEWFKNKKELNLVKSMYAESIAQANGALQRYQEEHAEVIREFIDLPTLEENDDDLESIFNEVKNKQQGGKKKSKKRTKKGGKKRTTKKNKKRTTKKSKKRTTKKRK